MSDHTPSTTRNRRASKGQLRPEDPLSSSSLESSINSSPTSSSNRVEPTRHPHIHGENNSLRALYASPLYANEANSDSHESSPWNRKIVLTLDGGGVRGYSSLLILRDLMLKIESIERNNEAVTSSSDYPWNQEHSDHSDKTFYPHHYFDYVAGTSTGGLSAIMLGRLRMSVDEAIEEYKRFGNSVFGKARWFHEKSILFAPRSKYATRKTRRALQDVVKRRMDRTHPRTTIRDRPHEPFCLREHKWPRCRTMVVAFCKDREQGTELRYLLRSYDHHSSRDTPMPDHIGHGAMNPGPAHNGPIWEVAWATSAAPTYFEAIKIQGRKFLDGGIGGNNPTLIAFKEVKNLHDIPPSILVSIGTGIKRKRPKQPKRQRYRDEYENFRRADTTGRKQFLKKYFELFRFVKDFAADPEETERTVHFFAQDTSTDYRRFNVEEELGHVYLDEWKPPKTGAETLRKIETHTQQYLNDAKVRKSLQDLAESLVSIRQARARTERWEQFATDYVYKCKQQRCRNIPKDWRERHELRRHLAEEHHVGSPKLDHLVDRGRVLSWSKQPGSPRNGQDSPPRGNGGFPKDRVFGLFRPWSNSAPEN